MRDHYVSGYGIVMGEHYVSGYYLDGIVMCETLCYVIVMCTFVSG